MSDEHLKKEHLSDEALKEHCAQTLPATCSCAIGPCESWKSFTEDRWPQDLVTKLGSLRTQALEDASFEEYHPSGTRYESALAPIATAYFPYNRCDVFRCCECTKVLLRYTEFGGYYVDHRVREALPHLIVNTK